jgi:SMI1-KNR4 cell-wall
MSMQDYEAAREVIRSNPSRAKFVGPRDPELVDKAEQALGLRFPPTYRRFLEELGAGNIGPFEVLGVIDDDFEESMVPDGIWYTLTERETGLPDDLAIVGEVGDGSLYALRLDGSGGEAPVVLFEPGADDAPEEVAYEDFGAFLRAGVERVAAESS